MRRSSALAGHCRVPGDKSISHRALIFGALATGTTRIRGLLEADDVINTARAVAALGAPAEKRDDIWEVKGRGPGGLRQPAGPLDFGNSGTGTRLMMGVIAGHPITVLMTGDASLSRRPMRRVLAPLMQMGLEVLEPGKETLPLTLRGTSDLVPIVYALPVPSAQVKSAVLIAGLHAAGETTVIEAGVELVKELEHEYEGAYIPAPDRLHCFIDAKLAPGYIGWMLAGVGAVQIQTARKRKPATRAFDSVVSFSTTASAIRVRVTDHAGNASAWKTVAVPN